MVTRKLAGLGLLCMLSLLLLLNVRWVRGNWERLRRGACAYLGEA